jgi:hypothetical protein
MIQESFVKRALKEEFLRTLTLILVTLAAHGLRVLHDAVDGSR